MCRFAITVVEDGKRRVEYIAPHHKNERRSLGAIRFMIPAGDLTDLLLLHITKGHQVLCKMHRVSQPKLFMTNSGMDFMSCKSMFNYFWYTALIGTWCPDHKSLSAFTPSSGRTMYVEHVTSLTGYQPELWEGPARCMGSSAKTWALHYAPGLNARQMQAGADGNRQWRAPTDGSGPSSDGGGPSGVSHEAAQLGRCKPAQPAARMTGCGKRPLEQCSPTQPSLAAVGRLKEARLHGGAHDVAQNMLPTFVACNVGDAANDVIDMTEDD